MDQQFDMSKLYRSSDGNYRDKNGKVIGYLGQNGGLNGKAWRYLASKYGKDYANRTSALIRNGKIYQNGKWRDNDVKSDQSGKTASYNEAISRAQENRQNGNYAKILGTDSFIDIKTGKPIFYNQKDEQSVKQKLKAHFSKTKYSEPKDESWSGFVNAPFKKSEWDNNLSEAWDSLKFNLKKAGQAAYNISPIGSLQRLYKFATDKNYGYSDLFLDSVGDASRVINGAVGAAGSVLQAVLPKTWEQGLGKMGAWLDPSKYAGTIASLADYYQGKADDWHGISNEANKGFGEGWLGRNLSTKAQDTLSEAGNALVTVGTMGSGGIGKSILGGVRTGAKALLKPGTLLKTGRAAIIDTGESLKTIGKSFTKPSISKGVINARNELSQLEESLTRSKQLPFVSNAHLAAKSARQISQAFNPGKVGIWNRTKSLGSAGINGYFAVDPLAFAYNNMGMSRQIYQGWKAQEDNNIEDYDYLHEYYKN